MLWNELKQYIMDNDKIQDILEKLECHSVKEHNKEYRAGLPNRNNKTSIVVKKDSLSVKIYKPDDSIVKGNIFTLCMELKNVSFSEANKTLHNILGLKYVGVFKNENKEEIVKKDILSIFTKYKKRKSFCVNIDDIKFYNEDILDDYLPYTHINWIREGIMPWACEKFKIGFSPKHKRIIIPHRYHNGSENEYIGIIGRTVVENYDMFDIPKYYPLKPYSKSINLYGLQENYKHILENGYVIVWESEKSVLKTYSWLEKTGIATCCHDLSEEQIKILIGLDVEIVIAFDVGVDINHIRNICNNFYGIRKISYIFDKHGVLGDPNLKNSPADCGKKKFDYLFKYRNVYDENERKEFLIWREKHQNNYKK